MLGRPRSVTYASTAKRATRAESGPPCFRRARSPLTPSAVVAPAQRASRAGARDARPARRSRRGPRRRAPPARAAGRPGHRDERTVPESDRTASNALEVDAPRAPPTRRRHLDDSPRPRSASRYLTSPSSHRLPARPPPDCPSRLLLPAHPHARPPPACRRPASGPPASLPGLPCPIYLAGRGRGVQREAVDPPSSKAQA